MERDESVLPEVGLHLPGQREAAMPGGILDGEPEGEMSDMILTGSVANPNRLRLGVAPSI